MVGMMQLLLKRIAITLTVILLAIGAEPANAAQQQWGVSYLDWSGALLSSSSTISQIIEPLEISPNTYWEAGWHWDNVPDGGYGGIQSKGTLADGRVSDLAIFSIWNGIGAIPGDGAGCSPFGGEGIGYSCRIPITLVAGNKYAISFGVDAARGPQWWIASIADLAKGTNHVIGSIKTNSLTAKASNWNNFIEYWGQAVPCDAVGPASAKFHVPTSSNPDVEISSPKFSRPAQPCVMSAGDTPPPGFIGDAVIRFGGAQQAPSTQTMPYSKTRAQLALDKAAADKAAANAFFIIQERNRVCLWYYPLLEKYLNDAVNIKKGLGVKQEFETNLKGLVNGFSLILPGLAQPKKSDSVIFNKVSKAAYTARLKSEKEYFMKARVGLVEKNKLDINGIIQHLTSLKTFARPVCGVN
jgi:hypothetical protein